MTLSRVGLAPNDTDTSRCKLTLSGTRHLFLVVVMLKIGIEDWYVGTGFSHDKRPWFYDSGLLGYLCLLLLLVVDRVSDLMDSFAISARLRMTISRECPEAAQGGSAYICILVSFRAMLVFLEVVAYVSETVQIEQFYVLVCHRLPILGELTCSHLSMFRARESLN